MNAPRITSLSLAVLLSLSNAVALADASTGPNNPTPKGTNPSAVGVPSGTNNGMVNGNTDGSVAPPSPANGSNNDLKPQQGGTGEGNTTGHDTHREGQPGAPKSGN